MTELKRIPLKYVRDRAKSKYNKGEECYICGSLDSLDYHHYTTLSILLNRWMKFNRLKAIDVLDWRDRFIEEHEIELFEKAITLCHIHHMKLHSVYGKNPNLGTAKKQERWVEIQKEKYI